MCACHPRWLANKTWLYQRSETSLLFPPSSFALCPLSASAASAQFEKQSSKSIITACAIRCWRLFSPPPSWNVAQSHPHFGFRFVFATLRYDCVPSTPLRSAFCLRNCAISLASCEFSLPQTTASAASIVQIASAIRPQVTQL